MTDRSKSDKNGANKNTAAVSKGEAMIKVLAMAGGLAGAAGLSQYPEFSQQYTQRLAGQVDALTQVVADFETSALRSGLTRTQAFDQMVGTQFLEDRQRDMRRTFARHAALTDNLAELRAASPLARLTMPQRLMDPETISKTWSDFIPAVPLSVPGIIASGAGFAGGWAVVVMMLTVLRAIFRRRPAKRDVVRMDRAEPKMTRTEPRFIRDTEWREP